MLLSIFSSRSRQTLVPDTSGCPSDAAVDLLRRRKTKTEICWSLDSALKPSTLTTKYILLCRFKVILFRNAMSVLTVLPTSKLLDVLTERANSVITCICEDQQDLDELLDYLSSVNIPCDTYCGLGLENTGNTSIVNFFDKVEEEKKGNYIYYFFP